MTKKIIHPIDNQIDILRNSLITCNIDRAVEIKRGITAATNIRGLLVKGIFMLDIKFSGL